ncbi:MAG: GNAT family N-acetyltransferase, partial [Acutalibacteraceae bacterium]
MSGTDIIARNTKKKKQKENNGNSGGSAIIRRNIENNARNIVFNELNIIRTTQEASQKSAKTRFSYDKEGNRLVSYLSDTKDYLDKVSKDKSEYQKKKDYINYIIKEYGAKISDEDKKTVTDYLNSSANDYNNYYDELEKIAKADHDYFSQWENEEAYNYSVSKAEKQKQYSKMSDDELDAEIEKLGGKSDGILDSIAKGVKKGFKSFALKNLEKDVISLNVPETAKSQIISDIEDEKNKTSENDSDLALLQKEKINRKIKTLDSLPDNVKELIEEYTVLDREKEEDSFKNDAAVIVTGLTGSGGKYDVDSGRSRREEIAKELNSLGVENWNELVEYNRIRRDEDYYKEENNEYAENAKSHPVLTSISTIPASVTKLMGVKKALESAVEDSDVPLNYNSPYFAGNNFVNTIRETVMENYDKHTDTGLEWFDDIDWFDQIYSTAMSTGDSVLNMALTGGTKIGGVVLGATAMSDTAQEVARNGGSKEQALLTGVIAGINEMLWENVSIGQFKSMTEKEIKNLISKKGIKTLSGNVLKSVGVNASEEFNTEVANIIVDYLVNGGLSSYAQAYDAYRQGGYTETEARKKARNDMINQTVMSGVGGAMQGLFMGGAGSALSGIITKSKYNQQANNMTPEEISTLQTKAKELGIKESDINVNVEDVGPWGESGRISEKKLSNLISLVEDAEAENAKINLINEAKKYGIDTTKYNLKNNEGITALYSAIAKTEERMQNEVEQLSDSIYINALKDRIVSLGESESYATYAAENLIRKKNGETLDSYRENSIKTSSAEIAYNELMTVGENAPQWVKDAEAQIDSAGVDLIKTYTRKTTAETSSDVQGEAAPKGESSTPMADIDPVVSEAAENFAAQMETPQKQEAARRLYIPALDRTTDFKTAFDAYYNAGLKGIGSFEAIDKYYSFAHSFPLYWRKNVFSAGRENKVYNPGVNAFYQSRLTASQKNQIRIMDAIGKKFGISFLVYDRLKDNGEELNGAYLSGTNKILVSLDADGKLYLRTAGHECLHLIEKWNSAEAQKLIEKVVGYLKNSADYDYSARVQWYAQRYNVDANTADGLKIIHSEMAADCMFDVFSNEKFVKELVEKNRTLAQKLKDVLQNFLKQLRNMMNSFKESAEMNALREQTEALEDICSSFHNSLRVASEEMQNSLKNEQKNNAYDGGVKYSLNTYSKHQFENWKNSKRIIIYNNNEQLIQFIQDSVDSKNVDKKMYFGTISSDLARIIQTETGLNVEKYNLSLGSFEIRKILKSHGNENKEVPRGQRAVTVDDFAHIVDVVLNPTKIELSKDTYMGKPVIVFKGEYNGRMNVTAVVSDKRLDLFVQTVFVNIKKGNLSTPVGEQAPTNTPEANNGTVSNNSIRNLAKNVNALDDIETKYNDKTDYLFLHERSDTISISNMVVKEEYRNQGIGTQILNDIIAYADEKGKTITLTPTTEFGTQNKLKKWYKVNGFVENKGKNADLRLSDTMYRLPNKNSKSIKITDSEYSSADSEGRNLSTEQQKFFRYA